MKIESSKIAMSSEHSYNSYTRKESMTMSARASENLSGAILTLSQESKGNSSYVEEMKLYQQSKEEEASQKRKENEQSLAQNMLAAMKESEKNAQVNANRGVSDLYEMKLEMLKKLLAMLKEGKQITDADVKDGILDMRSARYKKEASFAISKENSFELTIGNTNFGNKNAGGTRASGNFNANVWEQVTVQSGYTTEWEGTAFASKGNVQTSDGRSISFNIEVGMSREFTSQFNKMSVEKYVVTDPLVINLDTDMTSITDQKFFFDLDSDGKDEEISFAGKGSGFLAYDKNGDGIINDGSELFGTKSGDGFRDLAAYDQDGNGWIDENDDIFRHLRVWTKDENGEDQLLDLKSADVGAIFLENANTEFTMKDSAGQTNGIMRKTGIYLKESNGSAGTLSHVDLVL